jgi:hypothetical protein
VDGDYMEYVIGALIVVAFFIVFLAGGYIGYRLKHTKSKPPDTDDRQKNEMKQLNDEFKKIFSYNVNTALQRKKV